MKKGASIAIIAGAVAVAIAISAAVMSTSSPAAVTRSNNQESAPEVFPVDSTPYGKTYGEWTAQIWRHFQEIPLEMNPANDPTGEFCNVNQDDPDAWYVHSTFGGKQERECTVPADRALVLLIGGVSCSYAEDPTLRTPDDLRRCAEENIEDMRMRASINGHRIPVEGYYSVTPITPVLLPEGNVWAVQGPVETEFAAAGWTLVVSPLPEGQHVLEFSAEERQIAITGEPPWSTEVVYHLTVSGSDS